MNIRRILFLAVALMLLPAAAHAQGTPAAKEAYLYFVWPQDGSKIKSPFWCRFGLRNMGVTHAGDDFANSGHHHLLIDVNTPLEPNDPIPQDKIIFTSVLGRRRRILNCHPASTRSSLC